MKLGSLVFLSVAMFSVACATDGKTPGTTGAASNRDGGTDTEEATLVVNGVHDTLLADIKSLHAAAVALQAAAPTPTGRGWDATLDKDAITSMTNAWIDARHVYERTEGAIAPQFSDVDFAIDARYDDFMGDATILAAGGDQDLFDGKGVTGMHAIERILYQPVTPPDVIKAESALAGYKGAAWPATEAEAAEFKGGLCAELVKDTQGLVDAWAGASIDLGGAYQGLIALMNEQREKVNKAGAHQEESRYSQRTMVDIRDNLEGTTVVFALFEPWLKLKPGGADIDAKVHAGFDKLTADYATIQGDAFPAAPVDWSQTPTAADKATPFGVLYTEVDDAVDPTQKDSLVDAMNQVADALGLEEFKQ